MLTVSYIRDNGLWLTFSFVVERAKPPDRISHACYNPFVTKSYVTIDLRYVCDRSTRKFAGKRSSQMRDYAKGLLI